MHQPFSSYDPERAERVAFELFLSLDAMRHYDDVSAHAALSLLTPDELATVVEQSRHLAELAPHVIAVGEVAVDD